MIGPRGALAAKGLGLIVASGLMAAWMAPPTRQHAVFASPLDQYRHKGGDAATDDASSRSPFDFPTYAVGGFATTPDRDVYRPEPIGDDFSDLADLSVEPPTKRSDDIHLAATREEAGMADLPPPPGATASQTPDGAASDSAAPDSETPADRPSSPPQPVAASVPG